MDTEQLLQDLNIHYQTEGHKHCRPGWANMPCPFCTGNPGLHLGITIDGKITYCWRCGWKPLPKTIAALLKVNEGRAKEIIRSYGGKPKARKSPQSKILKKPFKLPTGTGPLFDHHKRYLERRGFDPDHLEQEWNLISTGPVAKLSKADYRHRILIPIYWQGEMVSFQARDVTGKSDVKYKACPKEREIIHHKSIVYHHQDIDWSWPTVVVEGVTDTWRLSKQAVAIFGIEFTHRQALELIKKKKASKDNRVVILFDDDPQAQVQAKKLQMALEESGLDCQIKTIQGDPADLSDDEAEQLIKEVNHV